MYSSSQSYEYVNTKELLPKLDQENLFLKYTGIYPDTSKMYHSIFRKDRNPGCRFVWHSGILYFKDNATYNGYLYFNIADVVSILHNCNLKKALHLIMSNSKINNKYVLKDNIKTKPEIRFKYKAFAEDNYFGIDPKDLMFENVYLVTDYWIKHGNDWEYNNIHNPKKTLCIAYYFPHNNNIKLYFPYEKEYRFYTNCDENDVYGMYKLDYYLEHNPKQLIITKSQKDRLLLDYVYGYNAIAVQSETSINFSKNIIDKIQLFDNKLIIFDYDVTGQKYASMLSTKLNCKWINLELAKDVYDITTLYGIDNTKKYLNTIIK